MEPAAQYWLTVRLTKEQKAAWAERVKLTGMSPSTAARILLVEGAVNVQHITIAEAEHDQDLQALARELRAIGVNANQIARALNRIISDPRWQAESHLASLDALATGCAEALPPLLARIEEKVNPKTPKTSIIGAITRKLMGD